MRLILCLMLLPLSAFSQTITNIRLESSHDKAWVLFDLQATAPQDIRVWFVSDTKGTIVPKLISGALTRVPEGVNHRIDWEALKDVGAFEGDLYAELSFDMRRIKEEARIEEARIEQARRVQARIEEFTITVVGRKLSRKLEVADQDLPKSMNWDDAVRASQNLGNGWRLPDADELKAMYEQLHKQGKCNFGDYWYWSSSQGASGTAYGVNFFRTGTVGPAWKYSLLGVRAVRALP